MWARHNKVQAEFEAGVASTLKFQLQTRRALLLLGRTDGTLIREPSGGDIEEKGIFRIFHRL